MNPLFRNDPQGEYPDSWYVASADIPPPRPALEGDAETDVAILGAGYTGLSAALTLAERGYRVTVLEAHRAGFGASGRNGGQVGTGFNKSQRWLEARLGDTRARALWDAAEAAKAQVRDWSAAHAPDARYTPGVAHGEYSAAEARAVREEVEHLATRYGYGDIEVLTEDALRSIVRTPLYRGGVLDMGAGHIHPLRYATGLARAAEAAGASIHEHTEVTAIEQGPRVTFVTPEGRLRAGHAILAGNGYLPLIDRSVASRVMPINSFMAATEPLGDRAAEVLTRRHRGCGFQVRRELLPTERGPPVAVRRPRKLWPRLPFGHRDGPSPQDDDAVSTTAGRAHRPCLGRHARHYHDAAAISCRAWHPTC
jgi:gamma-glutamylputrescine oxidase